LAGDFDPNPEWRVQRSDFGDCVRIDEVSFGQNQQHFHPRHVPSGNEPVNHTRPERRVGEGGDDYELVGASDDLPFDRVGVICGPVQDGAARLDSNDSGEGALSSGCVADDVYPVSDDDAVSPKFAGFHSDDSYVVHDE